MKKLIAVLALFVASCSAQIIQPWYQQGTSTPSSCFAPKIFYNTTFNSEFLNVCVNGVYERFNSGTTIVAPFTSYNGTALVANGVPIIVAKFDASAQAANIANTTLYAVPVGKGGMYRISGYVVITQAATTSSTMPGVGVVYTDNDTGVVTSNPFTGSSTANTVGRNSAFTNTPSLSNDVIFNAQAGSNIQYNTSGYLSSGATPMQYSIHVKLEYLGN